MDKDKKQIVDVFQQAYEKGIYFDRCVDLVFYDETMQKLGTLRTPKTSIKPSITVKGELIEGSYAISSFISIQNMAYDVDVNAVKYIDCFMYYASLRDAPNASVDTNEIRNGHNIFFTVLYADQEKEPPNRAVRFQCTVAAHDRTRFEYGIEVTPNGKINATADLSAAAQGKKTKVEGNGNKIATTLFVQGIKAVAKAYNASLQSSVLSSKIEIKRIRYEGTIDTLNKVRIKLVPGFYTIGDFLRKLNSYQTEKSGNVAYCDWKITIQPGYILVQSVIPENWRQMAIAKGNTTETAITNFYKENFGRATIYEDDINPNSGAFRQIENKPVVLNYVKSAYRTEVVLNVVTMFDSRIRPGSMCVIAGNAIMGRHTGRGGKSGSRLISTTNKMVLFRVTGGVNYEFSTTEDSSMTLIGAIVSEDYKLNKG